MGLGELFDTLVVFENYPVDRTSLAAETTDGGLRLVDVGGHDATHYPLGLAVVPGEQLHLRLDYRTDLFDSTSVAAIAARLVRLLEAAAGDPNRAIGGIDILSPQERHTILRDWNDTARPIAPVTLPDLFADQVARSPDAVAVVFEHKALTYRALDDRANQLAHHLQGLGAGPEVIVGLCLERSIEMIVGLLGILKAGAAYLPLDPDYPAERLDYMMRDAGLRMLLSHSALASILPMPSTYNYCYSINRHRQSAGKRTHRRSSS